MSHAWMPFYVADYLADTGHLSTIEHGAYMLLIMHYWQKGGLPADERMIARVARMTVEQWAESREVLALMFGDGWTHKRIDTELAKATEIVGKRRAAAEHRHSKSNAHALHVDSTCSDTGVPQSQSPTSETSSEVKRVPRDELLAVLDADRAQAVIEHRQRIGSPMTVKAAKQLAKKLSQWHDPNAAADEMLAQGWRGFKPEWMQDRQQRSTSPPAQPRNAGELARLELLNGTRNDPPNPEPRLLEARDGNRETGGSGIARRFTVAPNILGRVG
jgi:uncharacterized protein YdaU (DUF1376 family)